MMNLLPTFKQIEAQDAQDTFSKFYFKCSGLPIPSEYMSNSANRVFGIYWKKELIGGFILGRDPEFRTVKFFAQPEKQSELFTRLGDRAAYTEITCFWISRKYRTNTFLNFFVWLAMTYALRMYGTKYFLFGTCSRSLARLYAQTSKSILIHEDRVNRKATFIFNAERNNCVTGMFEIIVHKLKRVLRIAEGPRALLGI